MHRPFWRSLTSAAAVGLLFAGAASLDAQSQPWIHIHVVEDGDEEGKEAQTVKVNLPLAAVTAALKAAPEKIAEEGKLKLRKMEVSIADLREVWQQIRSAGDAQFVTVEKESETVSITRDGDLFRINVIKRSGQGETVQVDVPVQLVDALFSGEGPDLNFEAAAQVLADLRGNFVHVKETNSEVRIWIDERS